MGVIPECACRVAPYAQVLYHIVPRCAACFLLVCARVRARGFPPVKYPVKELWPTACQLARTRPEKKKKKRP